MGAVIKASPLVKNVHRTYQKPAFSASFVSPRSIFCSFFSSKITSRYLACFIRSLASGELGAFSQAFFLLIAERLLFWIVIGVVAVHQDDDKITHVEGSVCVCGKVGQNDNDQADPEIRALQSKEGSEIEQIGKDKTDDSEFIQGCKKSG